VQIRFITSLVTAKF